MSSPAPAAAATNSSCPRCGARFQCAVVEAMAAQASNATDTADTADTTDAAPASAPCGCAVLTLAPGTFERLAARYNSCLCLDCLQAESREQELEQARAAMQSPTTASPAEPSRPGPGIESAS